MMKKPAKPKKVFKIEKDQGKRNFIISHTFDDIDEYIPGEKIFFKSNLKNNKNKKNAPIPEENSATENKIKLRVVLNYSYQKDYFLFCLPARITYNNEQKTYQFYLNDIIDLIHSYANDKTIFLNEDYGISYYTNDELMNNEEDDTKTYFFIGNFPLNPNLNYCVNLPSDGVVYLKFRKKISKDKCLRYDIFEEENEEEIEEGNEENKNNSELNYNTSSKRAKEKRIGYIIKKVFEWKAFRKYTDNKMSLLEAADNVGLSKKSLDEYLNQIKEGSKYNFDFNKHKKDKVNILRGYVKKMNGGNGIGNKIKLGKKTKRNQKKKENNLNN